MNKMLNVTQVAARLGLHIDAVRVRRQYEKGHLPEPYYYGKRPLWTERQLPDLADALSHPRTWKLEPTELPAYLRPQVPDFVCVAELSRRLGYKSLVGAECAVRKSLIPPPDLRIGKKRVWSKELADKAVKLFNERYAARKADPVGVGLRGSIEHAKKIKAAGMMTGRQICQRIGISTTTWTHYRRHGVIPQPKGRLGKQRFFTRVQVRQIERDLLTRRALRQASHSRRRHPGFSSKLDLVNLLGCSRTALREMIYLGIVSPPNRKVEGNYQTRYYSKTEFEAAVAAAKKHLGINKGRWRSISTTSISNH